MSRQLFRSSLLVLLLVLFSLPAGASEHPRFDLRTLFQGWLVGFWSAAGCVIDPNGACGTASAAADAGCVIDPNGQCVARQAPAAAGSRDAGCAIDPNGQCLTWQAPAAAGPRDEGCAIDPNGRCAF
jgi:hypothetical protein